MARKNNAPPAPSPEGMREQRRHGRRKLEEIKVYQLVQDKELDLLQKDDYKYISKVAAEMGWSHGRLEKTISRVWDEARRDLGRQETAKKRLASLQKAKEVKDGK